MIGNFSLNRGCANLQVTDFCVHNKRFQTKLAQTPKYFHRFGHIEIFYIESSFKRNKFENFLSFLETELSKKLEGAQNTGLQNPKNRDSVFQVFLA